MEERKLAKSPKHKYFCQRKLTLLMTELQRRNRQTKILEFLAERKCISVACIEKEADIPSTTIGQAKFGSRGMPIESIQKLEKALKKYGYK